jgi:hypothetical protein
MNPAEIGDRYIDKDNKIWEVVSLWNGKIYLSRWNTTYSQIQIELDLDKLEKGYTKAK